MFFPSDHLGSFVFLFFQVELQCVVWYLMTNGSLKYLAMIQ
jgi:hypothetical protein